jgi:hypothetical protein
MDFSDYSLALIFVVSIVAIFAATELGRQLGLLASRRQRESISTIERLDKEPRRHHCIVLSSYRLNLLP